MSVFISDIDTAKQVVATEMTSNFYKYNTALYKIFIHELLAQFAVWFKCWFKWIRLLLVAYENLKTKEKSSWVIPKVVAVANITEAFHYKVEVTPLQTGFSSTVQTGFHKAGRNKSRSLTRVVERRASTVQYLGTETNGLQRQTWIET